MDNFPIHEAARDAEGQPVIRGNASILISPLFNGDEGETLGRGKSKATAIEAEARFIADAIETRLSLGQKVYDKHKGGYRPLRAADCAILYRASTHARTYAAALRLKGISVRIEEGQSFFSRPEILDLLSLCRLMAYPNDIQAAYHVLKSPLIGIDDSDLLRVLRLQKITVDSDASLRHSDQVSPLLDALGVRAALLKEFFTSRHLTRPYICLHEFCEKGRWLQNYVDAFDTEEGLLAAANLQKFMELVLQTDNAAQLSWMQALRAILDKEKEETISLASVSEDSVQLMTIHKAKGLEWPLVVVTGTGEEWEKADLYWAKLKDTSLGTGLAYVGRRSDLPVEDPHFRMLARTLNEDALRENYRLLYVALTRAQFELIITGFQRRPKDETSYFHGALREAALECGAAPLESDNRCLFQEAHDPLPQEEIPDTKKHPADVASDEHDNLSILKSSQSAGAPGNGVKILAPARLLLDKEPPANGSLSLPFPAEAGTYIHKALEISVKGEDEDFNGEEFWTTLRRHHPRDSFLKAWAMIEAEKIKILDSEPWQQLKALALHLEPELPIAYLKDDMLVRGIIDLLLQTAEKTWLVVDYKTSWEALQGGDLLDLCFKKRYDQQLALYKEGVQRLYPDCKVECAVFFTAQQQLVYLPS